MFRNVFVHNMPRVRYNDSDKNGSMQYNSKNSSLPARSQAQRDFQAFNFIVDKSAVLNLEPWND